MKNLFLVSLFVLMFVGNSFATTISGRCPHPPLAKGNTWICTNTPPPGCGPNNGC